MIGQHVVELGFKCVFKLDIINDTSLKEKERFWTNCVSFHTL